MVAYLNQEQDCTDLPSINQFVLDAKNGDCTIYVSTLTISELLPSHLKDRKLKSYQEFISDMSGAVNQISPDINILSLSARLRDVPYSKKVNSKETASRRLDVPDAIMLATAIVLRDGYQVKLDAFHTFDNGGKRSLEGGRCVPLLDFNDWCQTLTKSYQPLVRRVVDLPRTKPIHDRPGFPGV